MINSSADNLKYSVPDVVEAILNEKGWTLGQAEVRTGIKGSTIHSWYNPNKDIKKIPNVVAFYQFLKAAGLGNKSLQELFEGNIQADVIQVENEALQAAISEIDEILRRAKSKMRPPVVHDITPVDWELLPYWGTIPAADLDTFPENNDERHLVPREYAEKSDGYFRVRGDCMDPTIKDGDLIFCKRATEAIHGQIVVVESEGQITVKRLHREKDRWLLKPDNPSFEPLILKEGSIRAVVVDVFGSRLK